MCDERFLFTLFQPKVRLEEYADLLSHSFSFGFRVLLECHEVVICVPCISLDWTGFQMRCLALLRLKRFKLFDDLLSFLSGWRTFDDLLSATPPDSFESHAEFGNLIFNRPSLGGSSGVYLALGFPGWVCLERFFHELIQFMEVNVRQKWAHDSSLGRATIGAMDSPLL